MLGKDHKKKYLRHTDSIDDCDGDEEDSGNNIETIISKLVKKVNPGNIHSGNIDVILQIDKKNDETRKNSALNISNLLNSHIKDNDTPQENENSLFSVISVSKGNITPSKDMSIEMNVDNDLKEKLEEQEKKNILSTCNSNYSDSNFIKNSKNFEVNETNLSTLSSHLDNSRYYLNKQNTNKLIPAKLITLAEKNGKKLNNKIEIKENKEKEKDKNNINEDQKIKSRNKQSSVKGVNSSIDSINKTMSKTLYQKRCFFGCNCSCDCEITNKRKWRRRLRNCSIITLARDIFITLVIISALGFYITIFFLT